MGDEKDQFTFGMVENYQYFLNIFGEFCQKINKESYVVLSKTSGHSFIEVQNCTKNAPIELLFPKFDKIEKIVFTGNNFKEKHHIYLTPLKLLKLELDSIGGSHKLKHYWPDIKEILSND